MLAGGGLNSFSSILASFTYWHDFPNSTMLLSIFRVISLKSEKNKTKQTTIVGVHLNHLWAISYSGWRRHGPGVRGPGLEGSSLHKACFMGFFITRENF
jgi:hypothetical protein